MDTLNFDLVPREGGELSDEHAERIMDDIQNLLKHIGMYITTVEMGFQGKTPDAFEVKFDLSLDPVDRDGDRSLINTALGMLENTLDVAGSDIVNRWLKENFTDPRYRVAVANGLIKLCEDLDGSTLRYGHGRRLKDLRNAYPERFEESSRADVKNFAFTVAGVLDHIRGSKDGNDFCFDTGTAKFKISAGKEFTVKDAEKCVGKGACLISSTAVLNEEGELVGIKDPCGINDFPGIIFNRMITPNRDIILLNPIIADISFDRKSRRWTLSNDLLGIHSTKQDWNQAVAEFHDYFIFLWETYIEGTKGGLSEEEIEIRDYLQSMVPF